MPIAPYYNSYFNPFFFGGVDNAPNVTLIGLGEGNDLAAEYLNSIPDTENITVMAQHPTFTPYFHGHTLQLRNIYYSAYRKFNYNITKIDSNANWSTSPTYIVFYSRYLQLGYDNPTYKLFKGVHPEKIIKINNLEYAYIYAIPASLVDDIWNSVYDIKSDDLKFSGDFNGDGKIESGAFRNSTGYWYFDLNLDTKPDKKFTWGKSGDIPVIGDFNGDNTTDIGVFRSSTGFWYFDYNLDGKTDKKFTWGKSGDIPVIGDFNGDNTTDIGVFRSTTGFWYFDYNLDGKTDSIEKNATQYQ